MRNWVRHLIEPERLILAWQASDHLKMRFRWAVGELTRFKDDCRLQYFTSEEFALRNEGKSMQMAVDLGYRGYPGFHLRSNIYDEGVLAAFMRRLPPKSRADFSQFKEHFCLPREMLVSDFTLLARTEAKLPGDGFSIVDQWRGATRPAELLSEVAGYRYYAPDVASSVNLGTEVQVDLEPDNKIDPDAVKFSIHGAKIGNVNRLQTAAFREWLSCGNTRAVVERINGSAKSPRAFVFIRVANSSLEGCDNNAEGQVVKEREVFHS